MMIEKENGTFNLGLIWLWFDATQQSIGGDSSLRSEALAKFEVHRRVRSALKDGRVSSDREVTSGRLPSVWILQHSPAVLVAMKGAEGWALRAQLGLRWIDIQCSFGRHVWNLRPSVLGSVHFIWLSHGLMFIHVQAGFVSLIYWLVFTQNVDNTSFSLNSKFGLSIASLKKLNGASHVWPLRWNKNALRKAQDWLAICWESVLETLESARGWSFPRHLKND